MCVGYNFYTHYERGIMKIIRPEVIDDTGSFTRATTATYYNSAGVLTTAAVNEPRFNYNPSDVDAGPWLLIEAAATNFMVASDNLASGSWILSNATISSNVAVAPTNTTIADAIIENTATSTHFIYQTQAVSGGTTFALSSYIKNHVGTRNILVELAAGATANYVSCKFNPTDGTIIGSVMKVGSVSDIFSDVEDVGNGWYRLTIGGTFSTITFARAYYTLLSGTTANYTGDGVSGVLVTGVQVENGTKATSYIPTVGAAVTRAADVNTLKMVSNIPENDYPLWNAGTTYVLGDRVLELTRHKIYESIQNANKNKALTDTLWWLDIGYDNRWRMFDASITSQTSAVGDVVVALTPGQRIDTLVGLNCNATSVTINVVDSIDGLVFSERQELTSPSNINDWYMYFYEPVIRLPDWIQYELPVGYSTATTTVRFTSPETTAVGELIMGLSKDIGITEWGVRVGTIDYSIKTKDAFGNYTIVPRNFSKRADYNIRMETWQVDNIQNTLASYRSTPIVYAGTNKVSDEQYQSTIVYGYYKDFSISITYESISECTLTVEGLT